MILADLRDLLARIATGTMSADEVVAAVADLDARLARMSSPGTGSPNRAQRRREARRG